MDFKVAGTTEGITALQMDIKIDGLSEQIFKESLEQAHVSEDYKNLDMNETISAPHALVQLMHLKLKLLN